MGQIDKLITHPMLSYLTDIASRVSGKWTGKLYSMKNIAYSVIDLAVVVITLEALMCG
jgi:hypothetical protein